MAAPRTPTWYTALLLGLGVAATFRVPSPVTWALEVSSGEALYAAPAANGLIMPVEGVGPSALSPSFGDARSGGRLHRAVDILAPRGSRVLAAAEGPVVEVTRQANAGLMIEQLDRRRRRCYTYAHLDAVAQGVVVGRVVRAGQTIGFVGTSGNAPRSTPHLHFAVAAQLPDTANAGAASSRDAGCGGGTALDPYVLLTGQ
jgi:murein DD-endopeptidase MepM/ murein hydrolase activator NlpD